MFKTSGKLHPSFYGNLWNITCINKEEFESSQHILEGPHTLVPSRDSMNRRTDASYRWNWLRLMFKTSGKLHPSFYGNLWNIPCIIKEKFESSQHLLEGPHTLVLSSESMNRENRC